MTKAGPRRDGTVRGGVPFDRGGLAALLANRAYVGEVVHKGRHHPGEHAPILDRGLFDAVQAELAAEARNRGSARLNRDAVLAGLPHDEAGRRMGASTAKKNGSRHRDYVTGATGQGADADGTVAPVTRVSAPGIEAVVLRALDLDAVPQTPPLVTEGDVPEPMSLAERVRARVERVVLRRGAVEVVPRGEGDEPQPSITAAWTPTPNRRRRAIVGVASDTRPAVRPIQAETRARLLTGIANARLAGRTRHRAHRPHEGDRSASVLQRAQRALDAEPRLPRPAIVQAAVNGTLPDGFGTVAMTDMPGAWTAQADRIKS